MGNATANRLRHRLAGRITELAALAAGSEETAVGAQDEHQADGPADPWELTELPAVDYDAELAALQEMRDGLADRIAAYGQRAHVSSSALVELEAERVRILADGGDAVQLRDRLATARQDLADWTDAARLHEDKLAAVNARIAELGARQDLAALRAELAPAVAERDTAVRATGGRMAAAVLAVRAAAEEFTAALADEEAARGRVKRLAAEIGGLAASLGAPGPNVPAEPESTILAARQDAGGPEEALNRAVQAVTSGWPLKVVAGHLADADGFLPPTREERAAEAELLRARWAEAHRVMRQPAPAPQAWTRPDGATSVDLDANGREIRYPGYRPSLPPGPRDHLFGLGMGR